MSSRLILLLMVFCACSSHASSLRFFGNGVNDIDRVKIRIDDPANNNPGPPADVGSTDFTVEFWMRPSASNTAGVISCGANYDWINGNIVFDRDRFNQGQAYGVSLGGGRLIFGVQNSSFTSQTICGSTDLRDNSWHHVALQRRRSDGFLWLFVDGSLEASADGPDGDISYPDNGVPGNFCGGPCTNSDPFIVIGAEKHDASGPFPSYFGLVDEVRMSDVLRYSTAFTPSQQEFVADSNTVALYHFNEGTGNFIGDSAFNSQSPGVRRFGGTPAGPTWESDTPFSGVGAGTIQYSASNYSIGENGANASITVTRSGGSAGAVSVNYATANGSATAGADYQSASGTLNWSDGESISKSFSVPILDDSDVEGDETVALSIANVTGGATLGSRDTATLTIQDNDVAMPGQLQLTSATYIMMEGAGTALVSVSRSGGSDGAVSVSYSVSDGTATAGTDYQATSGTLNWSDGDPASKSFSIPLIDDTDVEADETANIIISGAGGGATLGSPSSAVLTIQDNDVAMPGQLQLSSATYTVGEGAASAVVSVTRSGGSDGAVSVSYSVSNGSATAGADYQSTSGTLNWSDGDTASKSFSIPIIDDTDVESDETVNISISGAGGGATVGSPSSAVLTIVDNDNATPGSIQFSAADFSVSEGAGSTMITVTRIGGTNGAVSADYAVSDGTAIAGSDYQTVLGTLNWADGDAATQSFLVSIIDDSLIEPDETINLILSNVTGGANLGAQSSANLAISDNDVPVTGAIGLSASAYSVAEDGMSATVMVSRSGGSDGTASVEFRTMDGSAVAGADYETAMGTISWPDGDMSDKTIMIAIVDDMQFEGDEDVGIILTNVMGAAAGSQQNATLTIVDNEAAMNGVLQFSDPTYSVGENGASILVSVNRTAGTDGAVTVDYESTDGTATAGSDYQAIVGTLSWPNGDASTRTISIAVIDDATVEADETVNLTLRDAAGGAVLGPQSSAVLTIADDDNSPPPPSPPPAASSGGGSTDYLLLACIAFLLCTRRSMISGRTTDRWTAVDATSVDYFEVFFNSKRGHRFNGLLSLVD